MEKIYNLYNDLRTDKVDVTDFIVDKDIIWFFSACYNYLFKLNINTWIVDEAYRIPAGYPFDTSTITAMYNHRSEIVLLPSKNTGNLFIFNKENRCMKKKECAYPNDVWGIGYAQEDTYVYLPIKNKGKILRFSKVNYSYDYIDIPITIKGVETINKVESTIWLTETFTDNLIEWNMATGKIGIYENKPSLYKKFEKEGAFCGIIGSECQVLFPKYSNSIIIFDKQNNVLDCKEFFDEHIGKGPIFTCVHLIKNQPVGYLTALDCWRVYDNTLRVEKEYRMQYSNAVYDILSSQNIIQEYDNSTEHSFFKQERERNLTLKRFVNGVVSIKK